MSNLLKVMITIFIIGLVVMAIVFFSIFGMVPADKLTRALKGDFPTSTEKETTLLVSTTTVIERIIEREILVERNEEKPAPQPPVDTEPTKFEDKYQFALRISEGNFSPSVITVNKKDNVVVGLLSEDKIYEISIPDYGLFQTAEPGEEKLIAFQALTVGEFEIVCGGCREDFKAKLVVE